jgi:bacterioferritin-associated ferredoxin
MNVRPDKNKDVICHCSGTTKEKIKELVANNIADLDGISRKTGACSGCGACEISILELIAEVKSITRSASTLNPQIVRSP